MATKGCRVFFGSTSAPGRWVISEGGAGRLEGQKEWEERFNKDRHTPSTNEWRGTLHDVFTTWCVDGINDVCA
jgi:hypothetical protein